MWFQNRRQKWKKGGSKDDEVIEYSQYYDLFSRDNSSQHSQPVITTTSAGSQDSSESLQRGDENNQRTINIPDHLRMKSEQMCISAIQAEQQSRALLEQQESLKEELQRTIVDLKQSATNNDERHLIREQQMRAVKEESNARGSPAEQRAEWSARFS